MTLLDSQKDEDKNEGEGGGVIIVSPVTLWKFYSKVQ